MTPVHGQPHSDRDAGPDAADRGWSASGRGQDRVQEAVSEVVRAVTDQAMALTRERLADADAIAAQVLEAMDPRSPEIRRVAEIVCERLEDMIVGLALGTLSDPDRAADLIFDRIPDDHPALEPVADRLRTRIRARREGHAGTPSGIAVHGIVDAGSWLDDGFSLSDGLPSVRPVASGGLVALVGDLPYDDPGGDGSTGTRDLIRRHARLLAEVARHVTVLPLPFGTTFASEPEVVDLLEKHRSEYARLLAELDGTVEWTVRIVAKTSAPKGAADATAWHAQRILATDSVRIADRRQGVHADNTVFNKACLVHRDRSAPFVSALELLSVHCAQTGLSIETSGPWPPYHFVPGVIPTRAGSGSIRTR